MLTVEDLKVLLNLISSKKLKATGKNALQVVQLQQKLMMAINGALTQKPAPSEKGEVDGHHRKDDAT